MLAAAGAATAPSAPGYEDFFSLAPRLEVVYACRQVFLLYCINKYIPALYQVSHT